MTLKRCVLVLSGGQHFVGFSQGVFSSGRVLIWLGCLLFQGSNGVPSRACIYSRKYPFV